MTDVSYERYRELRDSRGLKDADIAKETGITKSTFSDWKHGRYIPKQPKLQKIADLLGVSPDYFTTGREMSEDKGIILTAEEKKLLSYAKKWADKGIEPEAIDAIIAAAGNLNKD